MDVTYFWISLLLAMISFTAFFIAPKGRRLFFPKAGQTALRTTAWITLIASLFLISQSYGWVKGTFIWLGMFSFAGCILVLIFGAKTSRT